MKITTTNATLVTIHNIVGAVASGKLRQGDKIVDVNPPLRLRWAAGLYVKKMEPYIKTYFEEIQKIRSEVIEMAEDGQPKKSDNGEIVFKPGKEEKDFNAAVERLNGFSVEVEVSAKLKLSDFADVPLSGVDLVAIQEVLDDDLSDSSK